MQSHVHKVHAYLAVTCHLHLWQTDQGLLCATAVTQGSYLETYQCWVLQGVKTVYMVCKEHLKMGWDSYRYLAIYHLLCWVLPGVKTVYSGQRTSEDGDASYASFVCLPSLCCPEVTLCGCQDVKIQLFTSHLFFWQHLIAERCGGQDYVWCAENVKGWVRFICLPVLFWCWEEVIGYPKINTTWGEKRRRKCVV